MRLKSALSFMGTMRTLKNLLPSDISMSSDLPPFFSRKAPTDCRRRSLLTNSATGLPSMPPSTGKDLRKKGFAYRAQPFLSRATTPVCISRGMVSKIRFLPNSVLPESVANASYGLDVISGNAELRAQPPYVGVDRPWYDKAVVAPCAVEDVVPCQNSFLSLHGLR